jgi:hypothetical protein
MPQRAVSISNEGGRSFPQPVPLAKHQPARYGPLTTLRHLYAQFSSVCIGVSDVTCIYTGNAIFGGEKAVPPSYTVSHIHPVPKGAVLQPGSAHSAVPRLLPAGKSCKPCLPILDYLEEVKPAL